MNKEQEILQQLKGQGFMPLFYNDDASVCIDIVKALYAAGVRIVEFTNRGKNALVNFKQLQQIRNSEMPDLLLSVGTIHSAKDVDEFIDAGADFLISPFFDIAICNAAKQKNVLWIPGCLTPTEIHEAVINNCNIIKLYPCNVVGTGFVSNMLELFPTLNILATGGVALNETDIAGWFKVGVCSVGFGSKLITKELMLNKNYTAIQNNTIALMNIISNLKK